MRVLILSPRDKLFDDEAREVILPGADGEFSVWDFHQPFIYRLKAGDIRLIKRSEGAQDGVFSFSITDGMAKMKGNDLTIMAEVD